MPSCTTRMRLVEVTFGHSGDSDDPGESDLRKQEKTTVRRKIVAMTSRIHDLDEI